MAAVQEYLENGTFLAVLTGLVFILLAVSHSHALIFCWVRGWAGASFTSAVTFLGASVRAQACFFTKPRNPL
jgi:hypothetical protein